MNAFEIEIRRRIAEAEARLETAGADGDDVGVAVAGSEIDQLRALAQRQGLLLDSVRGGLHEVA